jgi:hypothetical protein
MAVLEQAGHQVTAIDLASAGENAEVADDITSLEQYSRPLERYFKSFSRDKKVNSQLQMSNTCFDAVCEVMASIIWVN